MGDSSLDRWLDAPALPSPDSLILDVARRLGPAGFTVDDLRERGIVLPNPGAALYRLLSKGWIHVLGDERSQVPSSHRRHVRRFVYAEPD